MKKSINDRCPLQVECERKKCEYVRKELECPYYSANAREDYYISLLPWAMTTMTPLTAWSTSPSNSSIPIPTTPVKTWAT